eukprot:3425348-Amphidinium_carterae.5
MYLVALPPCKKSETDTCVLYHKAKEVDDDDIARLCAAICSVTLPTTVQRKRTENLGADEHARLDREVPGPSYLLLMRIELALDAFLESIRLGEPDDFERPGLTGNFCKRAVLLPTMMSGELV